ncbi:hypothetical protein RND81_12G196100 [Saponaria officinalis]|uniref:Uncharacterized protein n=1 Tax=Saponaria officinalis TaxID=3572 RepID=A0AAW1HCT9_SAPOF
MTHHRVNSPRSPTHRFKEYLKPGTLARIRDSKISTRFHPRYSLLTRLVYSVSHTDNDNNDNDNNSVTRVTESAPEFPALRRGPQCFGRKKLVAARGFVGVNHVDDDGVNPVISDVVSVNDLLVH